MVNPYRGLLPIAIQAIERANKIIRYRAPGVLTSKGDRDLATEVDYLIERDIRSFLRQQTPSIGFLGEEEGICGPEEMRWVLDPVDGTINFVRGLPLHAVSLGLIHHTRPVLGVIDLPALGGRYTAVLGQGAYVDDRRLRVSSTDNLENAVISIGDYAVGVNASHKNRFRLALTAQAAEAVLRVRMNGSAALDLAWLADGKFDASLTLSNHPWDMAAGVVIAREAGAHVVDKDGAEYNSHSSTTIAVTPKLVAPVLALVQRAEMAALS